MNACKQLLLSGAGLLFHILEHRNRGVQNISVWHWRPDSSVSTANRYGLERPVTEFWLGAEIFHAVQSGREAHPVSCTRRAESLRG